MKKRYQYYLIGIFFVLVLGLASCIVFFYRNNLSDVLSVFVPKSKQNIPDLINRYHTEEVTDGLNKIPLTLPTNFSVSIFASGLGNPRVMLSGPDNLIFVSLTKQGEVIGLEDADQDGDVDNKYTVADGLNNPHGLEWKCTDQCYLYIAESHQIGMYSYSNATHTAQFKTAILTLPDGGRHFTRSIVFPSAPFDNDSLLVSIGSSCDVCIESDEKRASIISVRYDGTNPHIFAKGLRNAVFMATHPLTGEVFATEMGRDELGDDLPPDEINIVQKDKNYGWPYCYGKQIHDVKFDPLELKKDFCARETVPSYIEIQAHSAPLGLAFFPEAGWSEEYWYDLLVAYHGSWNRTAPTGYKIVRYKLDSAGNYEGEEDFITGWLTSDRRSLGRPVDILIRPGGIIYISDDKAGIIYRVVQEKRSDNGTALQLKNDLIRVTTPSPDTIITSPLHIDGEARGKWFFEASFPVKLNDSDEKELAANPARAMDEWMTENFVPFEADLVFNAPKSATGTLILEKSNPSGLPEHYDELKIPVRFK